MVELTGALLAPLVLLYVNSFVILYALFKKIEYENANKFLSGMLIGLGIYVLLMFGSTFPKSETESTSFASIASAIYGGSIYGFLIFFIGWNSITAIFTNKQFKPSWLAGISISFVIFEIYFALRCVETIPFMENVVRPMC